MRSADDPAPQPRRALPDLALGLVVLAAMLLLALATRAGSLLHEVIDWDESTLTLVASGFARGTLPYVAYWDIKPPVHFLTLGWALRAFGENLPVVRAFGAVSVAIAATGVFAICARSMARLPSLLAAALFVAAASVTPMQPTLTEHLAVAFLLPGLWAVLAFRRSFNGLALAGGLISLAVLTRSNLAIPALALALYLGTAVLRPQPGLIRGAVAAYALGALVPVAAIVVLYAAEGRVALLFTSVVRIPLAYATGQSAAPALLVEVLGGWLNLGLHFPAVWGGFTLLAIAGLWRPRPGTLGQPGRKTDSDGFVVGLTGLATLLSLAANGAFFWHHLLQIAPFGAWLAGGAVARASGRWRQAGLALAAMVIGSALVQTLPESRQVLTRYADIAPTQPLRRIAAEIAADRAEGDLVFAVQDHLVYWYLGALPPIPIAAHPSNLIRPVTLAAVAGAGLAPRDAFAAVLAMRPRYIVSREGTPWYLAGTPEAGLLADELASSYELWRQIGGTLVYRRR